MSKKTLVRLEILCIIGLIAAFAMNIFAKENVAAMQSMLLGTLMLCAYFDERLIPKDKVAFKWIALFAAILNYLSMAVIIVASWL